jgi:hypothetical protein
MHCARFVDACDHFLGREINHTIVCSGGATGHAMPVNSIYFTLPIAYRREMAVKLVRITI